MGIFNRTSKVSIEDYCRLFYDNYMFNKGDDSLTDFYGHTEKVFKSIVKIDQSFSSVKQSLFYKEMIALFFELFSFAWFQKYVKDTVTIPQNVFTKQYLTEKGKLDIWDIMGEYNHVIARSSTKTASGEKEEGRVARSKNAFFDTTKLELFKKWEGKGVDLKCVARALNYFGADIKQSNGIVVKLLAANLVERVGCNENLKDEAAIILIDEIYDLYKGVADTIKNVRL